MANAPDEASKCFLCAMSRLLFFIGISFVLYSCSDKYGAFRNQYNFKSKDGAPEYADLKYWAAHPFKWDPSDSIPSPLFNEPIDTSVDVFFIHPTTYTKHIDADNALIDDEYINAKTDYSTVLYQASVFNRQCRVFSPRYRQASIEIFFDKDENKRQQAFAMAYGDIVKAFEYYMEHWNNGRPLIIAGHSQGSLMAEKLLKDYFDGKPFSEKLVVAYIVGWPVPREYFTSLKICGDSLQTGCVCSWRTMRNGYVPDFLKAENGNSYVTNPLTWTTDSVYAPRKLNQGSVLFKFNRIYSQTTDGQIKNGFLFVRKPRFPWSFMYRTKNYHIGDINLFYLNMRQNVGQRIRSYNNK